MTTSTRRTRAGEGEHEPHQPSISPSPPPSLPQIQPSTPVPEDNTAKPKPRIKIKLVITPKVHKEKERMPATQARNARGTSTTNGLSKSKAKPSSSHTPYTSSFKSKSSDSLSLSLSLSRNIDNIIFTSLSFPSWYPSWYPASIIGEKALDGKGTGIVVKELYVCGNCFGYSKVAEEWVVHEVVCRRQRGVPGRRVYGDKAGHWEVWEVDGGVETLFCQNLSLFAKLFLDNKSVFFDVSGFNYFLLVHAPTAQIIGFFSKEKMSWDNNNLACILIFPPWQRKGLGSILIGVSYEISRREEILGGPEKPISELGQRGYRRYWGAEIARWLLEAKETDRKKGRGMVDVERVSRGTWIAGEDCLGVLREMGVVERAGRGKGSLERVRVNKERVREWVAREGLCLERVVDPDGFVEGYGYKKVEEEVVD